MATSISCRVRASQLPKVEGGADPKFCTAHPYKGRQQWSPHDRGAAPPSQAAGKMPHTLWIGNTSCDSRTARYHRTQGRPGVEPGLLKRRSGKDAKARGVGSQPMRFSTDSGEVPRAHILMPFSSDQVVCYMRFHISCKTAGPCVGRARRWLRWQQCRSKAAIVSSVSGDETMPAPSGRGGQHDRIAQTYPPRADAARPPLTPQDASKWLRTTATAYPRRAFARSP